MEPDGIYQRENITTKYNSSADILQMIGLLKYEANKCYEKGDLEGWFYKWKSIKFQISGKLSKEDETIKAEKEKSLVILDKMERQIGFILSKKNLNEGYKMLLTKLVERYLIFIQTKLEKWGTGLIEKEDSTIFT